MGTRPSNVYHERLILVVDEPQALTSMKTQAIAASSCLWLSACISLAQAADEPLVTAEAVRVTIKKSLPYLEQGGIQWIEKRKCVSCHRVSFLTWSWRAASERGLDLGSNERDKLKEWLTWSVDKTLGPQTNPCGSNLEGVAQMLMAHAPAGPAQLEAGQVAPLVDLLLKAQQDDGTWKPGGQLPAQKRPLAETTAVMTTWNALALGAVAPTEATRSARQRAIDAVAKFQSPQSTEWFAAQLLLQVQQAQLDPRQDNSRQRDNLATHRQHLLDQQHDDGGWGWLTKDPSDALGTGQALQALAASGSTLNDPPVQRALRLLVATQQDNGAWSVKGTKQGHRTKIEETASYWGTAWTAIALAHFLPRPDQLDDHARP